MLLVESNPPQEVAANDPAATPTLVPVTREAPPPPRNEVVRPLPPDDFFGTSPLVVSELRELGAMSALAAEWSELLAVVDHEVFSRPEFITAWLRSFARPEALRLLVARDGKGVLNGVLPLVETRCPEFGVRALQSAANVHSSRFDLVARDPATAADAFITHLAQDESWGVLRLTDVPEGAACWNLLMAAQSAGFPIGTWNSHQSRHLRLPSTVEALRAGLSKNLLSNLRRRRRRLSELGAVTVEHFTGGPELDTRLEELFRVEASGWKGRQGTAIEQEAQTHGFYREVARAAADGGYLSMYFLRLDGHAIAVDLALRYRGRFLSLKVGYDEAYARFSPGQLLTEDELVQGITEGLTEFDLLGDDAPYKAEWADEIRPHHRLYIFPRTRTGRALCSAKFKLAPRLKRLLGR